MGKRKPAKSKRPSTADKIGISRKTYKNILSEASKARRRLRAFQARQDADNYFVPDPEDYTMEKLAARIMGGETPRSVLRELRNLTAEKIRAGAPDTAITANGYKLTPKERKKVTDAVKLANQNIKKARDKFTDFLDILPEPFNVQDIIQNAVGPKSIENKVNDLALFTPENLVPTAINEYGEAGTVAEYQFYRNILERENQRRAEQRKLNDPTQNQGYFRQQSDVDTSPIDIDKIEGLQNIKKKATTWDDPARVYRANLFLDNYTRGLNDYESALWNNGAMTPEIQNKIDRVREIIGNLYFNEEAITYATAHMPNVDIDLIYQLLVGHADFDEIYNDWMKVANLYID